MLTLTGHPGPSRLSLRFAAAVMAAMLLQITISPWPLRAQATEGTMLGTVVDQSSSAIAGVIVTVTNVGTNQRRQTASNENGEYVVTNLPLGVYTVAAEMRGFRRVETQGVEITIKARPRVDMPQEVGEVTQAVNVTGDSPILKTDTVEVGTVVSRQQLESLPQISRHLLTLASLTPSISHFNGGRVSDFSGGEAISLGLRYEWFPQWRIAGDLGTNFDLNTGKILVSDTTRDWVSSNLGLSGGALPPNCEYRPFDQVQPQSTSIDLSPRIGFAYSLNSRMVLRGGYGLYYSFLDALNMNNTGGAPFSFGLQRNGDTLKAIDINEGFPAADMYETLASIDIGPAQFDGRFNDPYVQKYNLNLQVSPAKYTVVEIGYSGFHSILGATSWRVNYPAPAPGDLQSRRPYPLLGEGFGIFFQNAARYNALELTLRQRQWRGLNVPTALTVENAIGDNGSIAPLQLLLRPRPPLQRLRL